MKYEEYQELYTSMLKLDPEFAPVDIPIDPLPGEQWGDTVLRFMVQEGMIVIEGGEFFMADPDKIIAHDPNLMKVLDVIYRAYAMANLDELEEMGLMYTTVNEAGEIIYELTEQGRQQLEDN